MVTNSTEETKFSPRNGFLALVLTVFFACAVAPDSVVDVREAIRTKGESYRPRTRHLHADGSPRYTNRLILESSPYLLQHAHNPVDWYAWGDEPFRRARERGVPVLLSVGYSTCHWCHVMEEESFEDEEIATYINEHYVAIKVDREERPDVDSVYMIAVQAMTGGGGWPMTVWLTPDREPIYAATYLPPRDGVRGAQVGFLTLLAQVGEIYRQEPERVRTQANALTAAIRTRLETTGRSGALPTATVLHEAVRAFSSNFDEVNGGFTGAPKFPATLPSRLLLQYHRRTGDARSLTMATLSLDKMARSGMYDQVGGGFHRYSTDETWLVPHFEKMLYDNALLAVDYLAGYQVAGDESFARVVRDLLRYVEREMTSPEGGFYSATDADSIGPHGEREEGYYFTWTPAELVTVLGDELAALVVAHYGVTDQGNFEGRNILQVSRTAAAVAGELGLDVGTLGERLDEARELLYRARSERPAPLRDEKILTAWNGLMISAYAQAGFVLDDDRYVAVARRAADFVLTKLRFDGRLRRSYIAGQARHNAVLEDYAFMIAGLLDLFEASGERRWLAEALALDAVLSRHYEDEAGGFYRTSDDHEKLLAREKPSHDGAKPSGNSIAALNLARLYELTGDDRFRKRRDLVFESFHEILTTSPGSVSRMLNAVDFLLDAPKEIVIVTPDSRDQAEPFLEILRTTYVPNRVLVVVSVGRELDELAKLVPLVAGKLAQRESATAYVCKNRVCDLPTTDPSVFHRQLLETETLDESDRRRSR